MKKANQGDVTLSNVMKATGLSMQEAKALLLISDEDLDSLCDTALSDMDAPINKVMATEN